MKNKATIIKQTENDVKNMGSELLMGLQCGPSMYLGWPFESLNKGLIYP